MRKLVSVLALVTMVWFVVAQPRTTIYLSTTKGLSHAAPASLAADIEKLCNCDKGSGPAAPVLDPKVLPIDVSLVNNKTCPENRCQPCFDCYGWQLFLSLNWPAKPSGEPDADAYFGRPGYLGKVGWETFANVYDLFGGGTPSAWAEIGGGARTVEGTSAVISQNLTDYRQADHNWLTDQDGNLVRYEIRLNKDEYEYIVQNRLYNQDGLFKAFSADGRGIQLPSGSPTGGIGTIEIKAAWRIVPKDREEYFTKNYKLAKVKIPPGRDDVLVALVGLHIAKKTPKSPQWVWATFEHKDNVPVDELNPDPATKYNFFNPRAPRGYRPNYDAPPPKKSDRRLPVQVIRVNKLPSTVEINNAVHALISGRYPDSVWKNYNLISVQWPTDPAFGRDPKSTLALPSGKPAPVVVANITMETYMQTKDSGGGAGTTTGSGDFSDPGRLARDNADYGKSSCIGCHRLSAVTRALKGKTVLWKTDYSMVFFKAK
jgi:hypothetical protein